MWEIEENKKNHGFNRLNPLNQFNPWLKKYLRSIPFHPFNRSAGTCFYERLLTFVRY